jgi:hypothetical protein
MGAPPESRMNASLDHRTEKSGHIYELLLCPDCQGVILRRYYYHEMADPDAIKLNTLYPSPKEVPLALPDSIKQEYEAALKERHPNAHAVLLRRVLELVCRDRQASGSTLNAMLADLA